MIYAYMLKQSLSGTNELSMCDLRFIVETPCQNMFPQCLISNDVTLISYKHVSRFIIVFILLPQRVLTVRLKEAKSLEYSTNAEYNPFLLH